MAGKPYGPIYDLALERASDIAGGPVEKSQVLAIGDGMGTDITGARDNDLACLFISGGIHDREISTTGSTQDIADIARKAVTGVNIVGAMRNLEW